MKNFNLVFDKFILKQLKKSSKNKLIKNILSKIFDKIEELGPRAGKLIDSKLQIYEIKNPAIRLYYKYNFQTNEIYIFKYEMKTSKENQNKTITKIRKFLLKT